MENETRCITLSLPFRKRCVFGIFTLLFISLFISYLFFRVEEIFSSIANQLNLIIIESKD